jgi:hypothetical protein
LIEDEQLALREQITRIDRSIAETGKLQEEARKYAAETRRFDREYRWFPWLQLAASGAALIAAIAALTAVVAHWH